MTGERTFTAVIENAGEGGAYVTVPFNVEEVFGKSRVKVRAWFDGECYRGSLARMGGPDHILIIRKDVRQKIGKTFGDTVSVRVIEDTEPRTVDIPEDFHHALTEEPEALAHFEHLSYSHRKEYVTWIEEAKKEATRKKRIAEGVERLKKGKNAKE